MKKGNYLRRYRFYESKKIKKGIRIVLAMVMMISGVNFNYIARADETEESTSTKAPTNFKVINYGKYTGIYVLKIRFSRKCNII